MIAPALVAGGLGLVVGSFVTTAALRAARGEQALTGRSSCDGCGVQIGYAASIPVVSYFQQRGACRACGGHIDVVHPIGEAAGGLGAAFCVLMLPPLAAAITLVVGFALLASSVVDAKVRRLPNLLTLVVAGGGLGLAMLRGEAAVIAGLVSAVVAFLLLAGLHALSARQGREASLGFGDVKLVAALALWLGAWTPWMVAAAAIFGLVTVVARPPADRRISFGPLLAVVGWTAGVVLQSGLWGG